MDLRSLPVCLLVTAQLTACQLSPTPSAPASAPRSELGQHATDLARLSRSTVTLRVLSEGLWGTHTSTLEGGGSGFVIDVDGERLVVTAAHVVMGATEIIAVDQDGAKSRASALVAVDEKADLAVLRMDGLPASLTPLELGGELEVGAEVVLISSPLGLSTTVAFGTVAAHRPEIGGLQLAAGVSPGSSGGLVADRAGRVVGVIRSKGAGKLDAENITVATPVSKLRDCLDAPRPMALSPRPDRSKMKRVARHQLLATAVGGSGSFAAGASIVVPSGGAPVEHLCAHTPDGDVALAIREVSREEPDAWREGMGSACATVTGGEPVMVWVGTERVGRKVELTIQKQVGEPELAVRRRLD